MSQNNSLHLAEEFLRRMGSGAEPVEIARLFSENLESIIAGDTGVLPWIGQKSARAAVTDFVNDSRAMIERLSFEVHDILAGNDRAVILGSAVHSYGLTGCVKLTSVEPHQPAVHSLLYGGRSADGAKLFQQAFYVRFDRCFRNQELGSNLLVARAGGDTLKNFRLARA